MCMMVYPGKIARGYCAFFRVYGAINKKSGKRHFSSLPAVEWP
ncbi:hypothetical protein EVA_17170 [gut metagenome]|uniref:Uncharacterized protein n=1 Tax=gut metagenome TaxID=749906 RepID=J9FJX1_9ZZZZ